MAKSLRSKRERKLRQIKRVRYGKKELQRLHTMLGIDKNTTDVEMKNLEEVATVKTAKELKMSARHKHVMKEIKKMNEAVDDLEEGTGGAGRLRRLGDVKTFVDEKGNFPEWMSRRHIKKLKDNQRRDNKREKTKRRKEEKMKIKNKKITKKAKNKKKGEKGKQRKSGETSRRTSVSSQ